VISTVATACVAPSAAERIDALLPQTQCRRCGYPSCRDYADALSAGLTELNRCPPGGTATITALALVLGKEARPLDPECGEQRPWVVARIDESVCIGCTLCIRACPVDAILGARKHMHTIIEHECTGCELCVAPCPVDCISLVPMTLPEGDEQSRVAHDAHDVYGADAFLGRWMRVRAVLARRRFRARQERLLRSRRTRAERRKSKRVAMPGRDADRATKRDVIRAAVERARQRRGSIDS
jgi:electron transport complex protein RnfB